MRYGKSRTLAGLQLADILCRNWGVLLLRGLIAVAFGIVVLLLTRFSLSVLVLPFGTYVLADGILGVGTVIGESPGRAYWWVLLVRGLIGTCVGITVFFAPPRALLAFLVYIAAWTIASGALDILTARHLRRKLGGEWLLVLGGLISVGFGVLLMALRGTRVVVLSRLIAGYAVVYGTLLGILALRARAAPVPSESKTARADQGFPK